MTRALALAGLCCGCAAINIDTPIAEKPLPAAFAGAADAADAGARPSSAQTPWREWFADPRLLGLIDEALANNQNLLAAMQRIEVTRAGIVRTTGAMLPQLSLGVGAGVQKYGRYTDTGAGNATTDIRPGEPVPQNLPNLALGVQSSWEIDLWGKLRHQREAALAEYLASIEGTQAVHSALISDLASAWFELLALDHFGAVLRESASRQQRAVEIVRLEKQAGRANELAVQQFTAQLASTHAREREVAQATVEAENRVNLLLGRFPQPIAREKALLFAEFPQPLSAGVPSELLVNRPDVRQAEQRVRVSQFDVKAARAAFFPNLNISAGIGYQAFNPAFLFSTPESLFYSVVGGLVAPIVNLTGIQAAFSGAKANQVVAMYEYQRAVINAFTEVANAVSAVQTTEGLLEDRKAQKAACEQSVATADLLYRAGQASYFEVLIAQQSALQAELDLVEAWKRRRLANVAVYRALGGGWR
ncbi:MAG: efflux transporter outer membrane subunit [Archangiaceae bacterium]|nr:efflux transporter outer membrane subunit [Archangiaceae bacterium]